MKFPLRIRDGVAAAALATIAACAGCSGLFHDDPQPLRMYRPEPQVEGPLPRIARKNGRFINLERIVASGHLKERIAWRSSTVEFGFYESRRWSELPERYVARELEVELFERRGYQQRRGGDTPSVAIEVTAFEEVVAPVPMALVELHVRVVRPRGETLFDGTCQGAIQLADDSGAELARAMGRALRMAVESAIAPLDAAMQSDLRKDVEAPGS